MGRAPCCLKVGLRKGEWSHEEDALLMNYIQTHGEGQWPSMPFKAGLLRCGKSCRLRWMNYLWPGIKRGNFTVEENDTIIRLHSIHGSRWSFIATKLSGRTDNEIKNHWNAHLKKKIADASNDRQTNVEKEKKTRKADRKLKKVKTIEKPTEVAPDPLAPITSSSSYSSSSSLPSLQLESTGFNDGLMSGALSSSTIDQGDADLLVTDFSRPNWLPYGAGSMDGQDELKKPFNDLGLLMMINDENEMLEKLYGEFLQLIEDGGGRP